MSLLEMAKEDTGNEDKDAEGNDVRRSDGTDNNDDLIMGKYKSTDDVVNALKEQQRINSELRSSEKIAPDEYSFDDIDLGVDGFEFDPKAPELTALLPVFKEKGLSQDDVNDVIKAWASNAVEEQGSLEDEIEKLGGESKSKQIINEAAKFVGSNFDEGEQQLLNNIGATADGVRLLQKLSKMGKSANVPADINSSGKESLNDLQEKWSKLNEKAIANPYDKPVVAATEKALEEFIMAKKKIK